MRRELQSFSKECQSSVCLQHQGRLESTGCTQTRQRNGTNRKPFNRIWLPARVPYLDLPLI